MLHIYGFAHQKNKIYVSIMLLTNDYFLFRFANICDYTF